MSDAIQRSFGRGEISPALAGRADLDLYKAALSTQYNFITPKSGGVQNRAGTEYVGDAKAQSAVREIPFVFSADDSYVLLFGDQYMRVIRDGAFVTQTALPIAAITQSTSSTLTVTAHGYSNGDEVYISTTPAGGMRELSGQTFVVASAATNTFGISYKQSGTRVDTTSFTAYVSGGTVAKLYTLTTTYSASEMAALDYAQYRDTLVIVHPEHPPARLVRSGHASWTLTQIAAGSLAIPWDVTATAAALGSETIRYKVTGTYKSSDPTYQTIAGKESHPGTFDQFTITGITNANPAVVTASNHGLSAGETVFIAGVPGMLEINNREYTIQLPSTFTPDSPKTIASITIASPMVVTVTSHGYSAGDKISFSVSGMTELNDITYGTVVTPLANTFEVYFFGTTTKIASTGFQAFVAGTVTRQSPNPTSTNTFQLVGIDSTNYGVYTAFGLAQCGRTTKTLSGVSAPTSAAPHTLSFLSSVQAGWPAKAAGAGLAKAGIPTWNVYKERNGVFGFIGSVEGDDSVVDVVFSDTGLTPSTEDTPQVYVDRFVDADNYPSCVAFHQQRLFFGNSNNEPQTIWASRVGDYYNFSERVDIGDDDGITITIAGTGVDPVRHLVPMRILMAMGMSSETVAEGTVSNVFAPGAVSVHADTHNGSGSIKPVTINNTIIHTQKDLRILMDLFYNYQGDGYDGTDISALASHMFKNGTIVDIAFQKSPNSIIWIVRSDGALISCTYIKDQSILAFAEHNVGGVVEGVCCIPEGDETALYIVVNRTNSHRFIERMASRTVADPTDIQGMIFVDSALSYDGTGNGTTTMRLTGSSYDQGAICTVTSSSNTFISSNVGDAIFLYGDDSDGERVCVHATITAYTSATEVTVQLDKDAPTSIQNTAITDWALAVDTLYGLHHLEGEDVSVQGDGWVVANPNVSRYDVITVSSGVVTLPEPHAIIHVGLPYVSDIVTCDIDTAQGPSMMAKNKIVNSVTAYVNDTREFWAGEALPDDDSQEGLKVCRQHQTGETTDAPPALFAEPISIAIKARWNKGGRVAIRNVEPLPCEIIAISPEFKVGS